MKIVVSFFENVISFLWSAASQDPSHCVACVLLLIFVWVRYGLNPFCLKGGTIKLPFCSTFLGISVVSEVLTILRQMRHFSATKLVPLNSIYSYLQGANTASSLIILKHIASQSCSIPAQNCENVHSIYLNTNENLKYCGTKKHTGDRFRLLQLFCPNKSSCL